MSAEPRTQREIMAALHMPVPQRNCCTDLLDDSGGGSGGHTFGPRHLALVIVTFTFSVMCLSIFRSGSATRGLDGSGRRKSFSSAPLTGDSEGTPLPLHYVEEEVRNVLLVPFSATRAAGWSLTTLEEKAKSVEAAVVGFVGTHTKEDTRKLLNAIDRRGAGKGGLHYILSVSAGEDSAQQASLESHPSVFADNTYFSVISKRAGLEILSARRERVAVEESTVSGRLRKTPFESLLLLTESQVRKDEMSSIPRHTLDRLTLVHEEDEQIVVDNAMKSDPLFRGPSRCPMAVVSKRARKLEVSCFGESVPGPDGRSAKK